MSLGRRGHEGYRARVTPDSRGHQGRKVSQGSRASLGLRENVDYPVLRVSKECRVSAALEASKACLESVAHRGYPASVARRACRVSKVHKVHKGQLVPPGQLELRGRPVLPGLPAHRGHALRDSLLGH